jgi:hypothetical protein
METKQGLVCDGCGQAALPGHIARRLQRLEWATRFRPVHIGTLLLGAAAPSSEAEFFYSPEGAFTGEAARLAEIAALARLDRTKEQLHIAFQRSGFFATHVLECPVEEGSRVAMADLVRAGLSAAIVRIRRSLRPKRIALIAAELEPFAAQLQSELSLSQILLNGEKAFRLEQAEPSTEVLLLRRALASEAFEEG